MITPEAITSALDDLRQKGARISPQHTNRASSIGFPCARRHVLDRTRWQEKTPPDLGLLYIFNEGDIQEAALTRDLIAAGFEVIEAQKAMFWKEHQLSAHFDFRLGDGNGDSVLCEVKSMSPFIWDRISTMQDMLRSRYVHLRGYPAQMMVYLLLEGKDEGGVFLLKNKSTGRVKAIPVELDYEYAEGILQRCELVNSHVDAGTLPEPCNDSSVCESCAWNGSEHCEDALSRDFGDGANVIDDPELVAMLDQRRALESSAKEYKQLDDAIKKRFRGQPLVSVSGAYLIKGTGNTIRYKATQEREVQSWTTKIHYTGETEAAQAAGGAQ